MMNESMSPNMMFIAQIEAERRDAGAKGYGDMVDKNDYSHLKVKMERRMDFAPNTECEKCGEMFFKPDGNKQRICDNCAEETRKKAEERQKAKLKQCHCKICGKTQYRVNTENVICPKCRWDKKKQRKEGE